MKTLALAFAFAAFALPALAVDTGECTQYQQLATLYEIRSLMLKPYSSSYEADKAIDRRLHELRGPLPDGGYRYVRWVRPDGDGPVDKHGHTVAAVQGTDTDSFEANGDHAFAVRVVVPQKKSLFSGNNPVWVGTVKISYTANGRTRTKEEAINAWMNPDTSRTIDLGAIADRVDASVDTAAKQKDVKNALVELHFRSAVPQDDPSNPAYDTITSLVRLRGASADTIDREIARVERTVFGSDSVPLLSIVADLRRADDLIRSKKTDDQEKGQKLMQDTLRRLR